jgi:hypothetical protein
LPEWGKSGAASGCRERRRHAPVLLGMEALARQPRPWSATGCTTETTRIASHRSLAKSPTGSTGFLATALQRLTDLLAGLGLEPKAAKTRIVHLEEEGGGGF